jgi:hypothetical protein
LVNDVHREPTGVAEFRNVTIDRWIISGSDDQKTFFQIANREGASVVSNFPLNLEFS